MGPTFVTCCLHNYGMTSDLFGPKEDTFFDQIIFLRLL